ncbi:hypothetical protein GOBAR_AA15503 [Gossypium barbadense]|uniref:Uncharacterized protein n=1 Tax=Gossypium barbadense TaxID=3634 RepID=A0A2P5XP66_GOSBA|nr:hypothetical protein GOBAR_AA15503 [Gossypium barbadense]
MEDETRGVESSDAGTDSDNDQETIDISVKGAILFVILASVFLLLLFFFMSSWFLLVLTVLFCIGGVQGMHNIIITPVTRKCRNCPQKTVRLPVIGEVSILSLGVFLLCVIFAVAWAVHRRASYSWVGQNILELIIANIFALYAAVISWLNNVLSIWKPIVVEESALYQISNKMLRGKQVGF